MSDLQSLYQSVILDHSRSPRNKRVMTDASHRAAGRNPMCGDEVTVWLRVDGDTVVDVSFVGHGCAISQASASLMTQTLKGKSRAEVEAVFERFHALVTGRLAVTDVDETLGRLVALGGVSRFPSRVKCASLAWHAMHAALAKPAESSEPAAEPTVSTE